MTHQAPLVLAGLDEYISCVDSLFDDADTLNSEVDLNCIVSCLEMSICALQRQQEQIAALTSRLNALEGA